MCSPKSFCKELANHRASQKPENKAKGPNSEANFLPAESSELPWEVKYLESVSFDQESGVA